MSACGGKAASRIWSGFNPDVFVAGSLGICVEPGNVAVQEFTDRAEGVVVLAHVADRPIGGDGIPRLPDGGRSLEIGYSHEGMSVPRSTS